MKERFGISLRRDLAREIAEISDRLGMNRSSLIEEMLEESVRSRNHLMRPHRCGGLLAIVSDREMEGKVSAVLERYSECIISRSHHHIEFGCVDISLVDGDSEVILNLERDLKSLGVMERYVPLWCQA